MASSDVFPWDVGVFDAHCHPTDTMSSIDAIPCMRAKALTIMATRSQDQHLVEGLAQHHAIAAADSSRCGAAADWQKLVPSFGWHPWFSHQLYNDLDSPLTRPVSAEQKRAHYHAVLKPTPVTDDYLDQLPDPASLSRYLADTEALFARYPTALLGEVGLDKSFRLPQAWLSSQLDSRDPNLTPGGRERRELSPYRVQADHQVAVLAAQLQLAGKMGRACSVHGVRATGLLFETLQKTWKGCEVEVLSKTERKRRVSVSNAHHGEEEEPPAPRTRPPGNYPPRVCLHSYSGDPAFLKQYFHPSVPVDFFASYSMAINFGPQSSDWSLDAVKVTPDDRILIESDLHVAGDDMDAALESIARKVCDLKDWPLRRGVEQLADNWRAFAFGRSNA